MGSAGFTILIAEYLQPLVPVPVGCSRDHVRVELFERAQLAASLAATVKLAAYLGGRLGDLVRHMAQARRACGYRRSTVHEHSIDLSNERDMDLQRLVRPQGRLGQQSAGKRGRATGVGLVQQPQAALRRRSTSRAPRMAFDGCSVLS